MSTLPAPGAKAPEPWTPQKAMRTGCLLLILLPIPVVNVLVFFYGIYWFVSKVRGVDGGSMVQTMLGGLDLGFGLQGDLVETNLGPTLRLRLTTPTLNTSNREPLEAVLRFRSGQDPIGLADGGQAFELRRALVPGVDLGFLVPLAPLDLAAAATGITAEVSLVQGSQTLPLTQRWTLGRDRLLAAAPAVEAFVAATEAAPEGGAAGTCLVCGEGLGFDATRCQRCPTWVHPGCGELLGACPAPRCGTGRGGA